MQEIVKSYYGQQLQSSADLKTDACCDISDVPEWLKPLLKNIHPEVLSRYYGCGLVAPELLEGCRVLDLGCGSGRDVYALAQMVGPRGEVIGVDMTDEQLAVAERHREYHVQAFGYANVRFINGYLEQLDELDLQPESFDLIVSNCVINLSADKPAVLRGVHRLLREGGEFYFSDVYADRRVPENLRSDPVLYGECLGGALYWNDFIGLAHAAGFADPRLVEDRPLAITDAALKAKIDPIRFFSAMYRLFKISALEKDCEDYGQAVIYQGSIPNQPNSCLLDKYHSIEAGKVFPICGNSWRMLHDTRFAEHFQFIGDFSRHYGLFPGCGGGLPFEATESIKQDSESGPCC